jgi:hypothetical protein
MEPNQFTTVSERWHVRRFVFSIAFFVESSNAPNEMNEKIRIRNTKPASNGLMSEHAFFEYRAKPMSTPHIKEQGEPIHCLIKMEIGAGFRRPRELLKQEARDLILFSVSPGPHRRISHSNICEVDEKRLRELGPARDFNRLGSVEIYFYSS